MFLVEPAKAHLHDNTSQLPPLMSPEMSAQPEPMETDNAPAKFVNSSRVFIRSISYLQHLGEKTTPTKTSSAPMTEDDLMTGASPTLASFGRQASDSQMRQVRMLLSLDNL